MRHAEPRGARWVGRAGRAPWMHGAHARHCTVLLLVLEAPPSSPPDGRALHAMAGWLHAARVQQRPPPTCAPSCRAMPCYTMQARALNAAARCQQSLKRRWCVCVCIWASVRVVRGGSSLLAFRVAACQPQAARHSSVCGAGCTPRPAGTLAACQPMEGIQRGLSQQGLQTRKGMAFGKLRSRGAVQRLDRSPRGACSLLAKAQAHTKVQVQRKQQRVRSLCPLTPPLCPAHTPQLGCATSSGRRTPCSKRISKEEPRQTHTTLARHATQCSCMARSMQATILHLHHRLLKHYGLGVGQGRVQRGCRSGRGCSKLCGGALGGALQAAAEADTNGSAAHTRAMPCKQPGCHPVRSGAARRARHTLAAARTARRAMMDAPPAGRLLLHAAVVAAVG